MAAAVDVAEHMAVGPELTVLCALLAFPSFVFFSNICIKQVQSLLSRVADMIFNHVFCLILGLSKTSFIGQLT